MRAVLPREVPMASQIHNAAMGGCLVRITLSLTLILARTLPLHTANGLTVSPQKRRLCSHMHPSLNGPHPSEGREIV